MRLVGAGLLLVVGAGALALVVSAVRRLPGGARGSGALTCMVGLGGALAGTAALAGQAWSLALPRLLPTSEVSLVVDPLSGLFMALTGGVAIAAGIYGVGYPHPHRDADAAERGMESRTFRTM